MVYFYTIRLHVYTIHTPRGAATVGKSKCVSGQR